MVDLLRHHALGAIRPTGFAGRALLLGALLAPPPLWAHGFGRLYNLPVPFWLYGWAASAVLVLSFLLIALFAVAPAATKRELPNAPLGLLLGQRWRHALLPLQWISVLLLLLCIATALWGYRDPQRNFSMSFFWVVFALGFTYLTVFTGNFFAHLNPWRNIARVLGRMWPAYLPGRWAYPSKLGDWPALVLYLVFIWFELFGHGKTFSLGLMLLGYSGLSLLGVGLVGERAWFAHCDFFAVFFRLVGVLAPLRLADPISPGSPARLCLRMPFAAAATERPAHLSTVVFALAMLSTTAFDGLKATQWWVSIFWQDPSGVVTALAGARPMMSYALLRPWYIAWESAWLVLSPFLYLVVYLACLAVVRALTRSTRSVRDLALDFGYTLLPIAVVYHATHYSTLMLTQGLKIISLISDPFGWGWNLFGTASLLRAPYLPGMGWVWHSQVVLILLGHVISVYLAHRVAVRVFPTRGQAAISQLPMLAFMVALTIAGLWILAQPLTSALLR